MSDNSRFDGVSAELFKTALGMLRWANDASGNTGLVYGYCKEHQWRGRKRDVNNMYADSHTVKMNAVEDALNHLSKKRHAAKEANHE